MWSNYVCILILSTLVTSKASPQELSHLARVYAGGDKPCVASLISNQHLLAQASCPIKKKGPLAAVLGGLDPRTQITVNVKERLTPDGFRNPEHYDDIAIFVLDRKVDTNRIKPACIQWSDYIGETQALATRWKPLTEDESILYLNEETVRLLDINDDCNNIERDLKSNGSFSYILPRGINKQTMLCAGRKKLDQDWCTDRSGGPLQVERGNDKCDYTIIGIPTLGDECVTKPGLYTKVSSYYNWIASTIWPRRG